jgi:sialate O-acetylesterase
MLALALALIASGERTLALPALFSDGLVLQCEAVARVWGWAEPEAEVVLVPSWDGRAHTTRADRDGRFELALATPGAGGPFELAFASGTARRVVSDVLLGEVWLAAGQSNMEWTLGPVLGPGAEGWEEAVAASRDPALRVFAVEHALAPAPLADARGRWLASEPESAPAFSACAYFFARRLRAELGVPVGVIVAAWGGTPAEAWMRAAALAPFPELAAGVAESARAPREPFEPCVLWNGMLAPLVPTIVRGVIWYQGESNRVRAGQYERLFAALIRDWRAAFGSPELPFLYVQIAPFAYPDDRGEAGKLRDAQRRVLALPNTGMAVTMDVGDPRDIHPPRKREVGERLALLALAGAYARPLEASGPLFCGVRGEDAALRVEFAHAAGLTSRGEPVRHLALAGADGVFHPAAGRIEGETLVVTSPAVPAPLALRFGDGAADETNLWNAAGLPAASFRTDDWP